MNLTVAGLGGGNVGYGARFVEAYESAYLGCFALALVVGANYLPGVVAVGGNFSIGVCEVAAGLDACQSLDGGAVAADDDA